MCFNQNNCNSFRKEYIVNFLFLLYGGFLWWGYRAHISSLTSKSIPIARYPSCLCLGTCWWGNKPQEQFTTCRCPSPRTEPPALPGTIMGWVLGPAPSCRGARQPLLHKARGSRTHAGTRWGARASH